MLKGPPSDKQDEESKKIRNKTRKIILDEIPESPTPEADEPSSTKTTREQRTEEWRRDLYNAE